MFLAYILVHNIYDSNDPSLTQMVIQCTTGVNSEDEDAVDDEDDKNSEEISNERANESI